MTAGITRTVAVWSACSPTLLSGRVPYPYPVMPSQYVVAVNTSSPSMRDKQWKNTLCRGIGILFLACYLSYLLD